MSYMFRPRVLVVVYSQKEEKHCPDSKLIRAFFTGKVAESDGIDKELKDSILNNSFGFADKDIWHICVEVEKNRVPPTEETSSLFTTSWYDVFFFFHLQHDCMTTESIEKFHKELDSPVYKGKPKICMFHTSGDLSKDDKTDTVKVIIKRSDRQAAEQKTGQPLAEEQKKSPPAGVQETQPPHQKLADSSPVQESHDLHEGGGEDSGMMVSEYIENFIKNFKRETFFDYLKPSELSKFKTMFEPPSQTK